eukprot:scaffold176258_cov49-Attheya_sp.AAC.1
MGGLWCFHGEVEDRGSMGILQRLLQGKNVRERKSQGSMCDMYPETSEIETVLLRPTKALWLVITGSNIWNSGNRKKQSIDLEGG